MPFTVPHSITTIGAATNPLIHAALSSPASFFRENAYFHLLLFTPSILTVAPVLHAEFPELFYHLARSLHL
jgi:hypothetical protein